jgi:8-oxo-dGTP pyrophosphatase MutT (NUDIX family)
MHNNKNSRVTASGIVIVRYFDDELFVLSMSTRRGLDIPKGKLEEGETPFSCAMRETFEESGIFNIDFPFGREHIQVSTMIIFIGETSQDPKISPNPVTGVFEHEDANWITFDEMEEGCMTFLLPAIKWARRKLEEQEN